MMRRYEIEEMLSQDANGVAFRARDRESDREVVLRRFFPQGREGGGLSQEEQAGFLEAVGKLKHLKLKELRKTVDGGSDPVDGMPFLVTEWVEGATLAEFTGGKPLESSSVKDILEVALKASAELSQALGHEAVWVGCAADAVVVPESGRGITFWVEPLATRGNRGLSPVADLAAELMGGAFPADGAALALAEWIRRIRTDPHGWTIAQALEALDDPAPAQAPTAAAAGNSTRWPPGDSSGPATTGGRSIPPKPMKPRPKKKATWPWAVAAALLLAGGGGYGLWKSGGWATLQAKLEKPEPKRPPTLEEIKRDLAAKNSAPLPSGSGWNAAGPPAKIPAGPAPVVAAAAVPPSAAVQPVPAAPQAPAVTADGVRGMVVSVKPSKSSGKTVFLEMVADGATRWVAYEFRHNTPGMTPEFLHSLNGKRIQATGKMRKDPHRGEVLHVTKPDDLRISP